MEPTAAAGMLNVRDRRASLLFLIACLCVGSALRLYGIRDAGVIFPDDLRAYSGQVVVDALTAPDAAFSERLAAAHRTAVEQTGARPALAWFTAIPAALGFLRIGDLYIPFALCAITTILLIWLLGNKWFDAITAFFSALWFATSAASVGYSRSALPVGPATALMVLGLFVLTNSAGEKRNPWRIVATGGCFAVAFAFHPAYLAYLSVPVFLLFMPHLKTLAPRHESSPVAQRSFLRLFFECFCLVLPTILIVILYDAPQVLTNGVHGRFAIADMSYVSGLRTLFDSPTIYSGVHEGVLFWPEYLKSAEGTLGFVVILIAIVSFAKFSRSAASVVLAAWMLLPWMAFALWPNLNSYGRLYAPVLPAVALMVGRGVSCSLMRLPVRVRTALLPLFSVLIIGTGLAATTPFLRTEGKEPSLGRYMDANKFQSIIGFVRTDVRSLKGTRVVSVFTPD